MKPGVVVITALLSFVASGCGTKDSPEVKLRTPGFTTLSYPAKPSRPFSFSAPVLLNQSKRPVALKGAQLEAASTDLRTVGTYVLGPKRRIFMTPGDYGFPTAYGHIDHLKPVAGYVVEPGTDVELFFKLRAPPGRHLLRNVSVSYESGDDQYSVERKLRVAICVRQPLGGFCRRPPDRVDVEK